MYTHGSRTRLRSSSDIWVSHVYHDREALMKSWRKAMMVVSGAALGAGQRHTEMTVDQAEEIVTQQEQRWWNVKVQ